MSTSTIRESSLRTARRYRAARRAILVGLGLFLAAGAANVFGVRSSTDTAVGGGVTLEVKHPDVARPGLSVPLTFTVTRDGGFDGAIRLATTASYMDLFDENGLRPAPMTAIQNDSLLIWEFEPPEGETLIVKWDARIDPSRQQDADAATSVLGEGDTPLVTVNYDTTILP